MNILFLLRLWPVYGGGETVTICLANELRRRGYNVFIAYFKDSDNQQSPIEVLSDITPIKVPGVFFDEYSSEFFVNKKQSSYVSQKLDEVIRNNNIEILVNQWWPVEFLNGLKKNNPKVKVVKCLHMDVDTKRMYDFTGVKKSIFNVMYPIYRRAERWKHYYSADKYLDNSDKLIFLAPCFLEKYRANSNKSLVTVKTDYVFNPIVYDYQESDIEIESKEKVVLFVGRLLEKHKKVMSILNIWRVVEDDPLLTGWTLKIVGDGPDRKMYEDYAQKCNLSRVFFEGFQDPLPYYKEASIFVMTSAYEGLPMTLIEAHQNGVVPIVMHSYDSVMDIIDHGVNGIISSKNNIDEYVSNMKYLMQDADYRSLLAKNGIESSKRYKVSTVVDKWELIFKELKA